MKKATQLLPDDYALAAQINLQTNRKLLIALNLASILLGALFTAGLIALLRWVRPEGLRQSLYLLADRTNQQQIVYALIVIAVMIGMLVLHEALHGVFFWFYTRDKVRFAFKGTYAYAAAPGWYFSRGAYLPTCLAPLVIITLAGLILLLVCPPLWTLPVLLLVITNGAGAIGDLYMAAWMRRKPAHAYYQDEGDIFSMYLPREDTENA
ncbi:MAG: DUF3267 domain-containing protein [Anaerolineaceae bacterium]|nr:DUF3267 domain-containing protein [Anaerolineaceae bacterium]